MWVILIPFIVCFVNIKASFKSNKCAITAFVVLGNDDHFGKLLDSLSDMIEITDDMLTRISWAVFFFHHSCLVASVDISSMVAQVVNHFMHRDVKMTHHFVLELFNPDRFDHA